MSDDYIIAINNARIFTIVVGSISALFPLSVVFILIQRYRTLVTGKSLVHYILMIAIADTMTAIAIAFGFPSFGSTACTMQGFCFIFFSRMSWFYTDVLIFQLFYVVVNKSYFLNKRYMHMIVFTLNIVLSLIPFSTGASYGEDDEKGLPSSELCGLRAVQWVKYAFIIWLYISFILIIILTIMIIVYSLKFNNKTSSNVYINERIKDSWKIIILYPLAMMITWVPGMAYGFYYFSYRGKHNESPPGGTLKLDYLAAFNAFYGPLLSLIFYTKTVDARRAWMHNLRCILNLVMNVDIDDRSSCSSIISIEDVRLSEYSSSKASSSISRLTQLTSSLWGKKTSSFLTPIINSEHRMNPMTNRIVRIEDDV